MGSLSTLSEQTADREHFMLRRLFLPMILLGMALTACGGATIPEATPTPPIVTDLQILVVSDDFAVGAPRVPFVFFDGPNRTANVSSVAIQAFDLSADPPVAVWSGPAQSFKDYEVPYWTVNPEIPREGVWGLNANVTFPDGSTNDIQFAIQVNEAFAYPTIGDAAIPTDNRTTADFELDAISTDPDPEPSFYDMTVTEALASGQPTVIMFATPAFCQTAVCAPAVDTLRAVQEDYPEGVNYIQVEIFEDFQENLVAASVQDWRLVSEPWTYVVDGDGVITGRFGGPVSPTELGDSVAAVLP